MQNTAGRHGLLLPAMFAKRVELSFERKQFVDACLDVRDMLVHKLVHARAPMQRLVDRFASVYTPAVFVFALIVAVVPPLLMGGNWHDWAYRALVLLVIGNGLRLLRK